MIIYIIASSKSFEFKSRIAGRSPAAGNTKDVKIAVSLKYLGNLCNLSLILTW